MRGESNAERLAEWEQKSTWLGILEGHNVNFNPRDYSLLLIDDDPDQLAMFTCLLQRAGFLVRSCSSVLEALGKLESEKFDLIISDLRMPGFGGDDLIRNLRGFKPYNEFSDMPLIILTCSEADLEMDLIMLGADMFCRKGDAWKFLLPQIEFLLT